MRLARFVLGVVVARPRDTRILVFRFVNMGLVLSCVVVVLGMPEKVMCYVSHARSIIIELAVLGVIHVILALMSRLLLVVVVVKVLVGG
jgi:hypothetical protein